MSGKEKSGTTVAVSSVVVGGGGGRPNKTIAKKVGALP
jgi:hypothetical protein